MVRVIRGPAFFSGPYNNLIPGASIVSRHAVQGRKNKLWFVEVPHIRLRVAVIQFDHAPMPAALALNQNGRLGSGLGIAQPAGSSVGSLGIEIELPFAEVTDNGVHRIQFKNEVISRIQPHTRRAVRQS
jgi:hypothetical protein